MLIYYQFHTLWISNRYELCERVFCYVKSHMKHLQDIRLWFSKCRCEYYPILCVRFAATSIMIGDLEVQPGIDHIVFTWKAPQYRPMHYLVDLKCKVVSTEETYIEEKYRLPSMNQFTTITDLIKDSRCRVTFTAVYNPATLDPGITINVKTLEAGNTCRECWYKRLYYKYFLSSL